MEGVGFWYPSAFRTIVMALSVPDYPAIQTCSSLLIEFRVAPMNGMAGRDGTVRTILWLDAWTVYRWGDLICGHGNGG